jgi:hypothetical protein
MFKELCKVTETDCFDSCKLSKSHLALEKRNAQVKLRLCVSTKKGLILETITQTEFNATRLLTYENKSIFGYLVMIP